MLVACYPILIHFAFRRNLDVRSDGLQAKIHPPGNWWRVCSFGDSLAVRLAPRLRIRC
jgi:hypothetical protein